jgi:carbon-monoxide dehydrogenase large subunit
MSPSGSVLGHAVLRTEDPAVLTGTARYTDDIPVEGLTHLVFVRSTIAHARIVGIDTSEAVTMPGVLGVFSAVDLDLRDNRPVMAADEFARPSLATDRVRFVGEPIAAVVAETRAQAVDAAELVIVDYDPLPAIVGVDAALAPDAERLFPDADSNLSAHLDFEPDPGALDDAEVVVDARFVNQRLAAVPLEGNAILVEPDGTTATIHVTSQNPHALQRPLAKAMNLEPDDVRVVAPNVGGGFGAKIGSYPEFVVTAAAAARLGRPVRFSETRSENLVAMVHGRAQTQEVKLGLRRDGIITGLWVRFIQDTGAYPSVAGFLVTLTRQMAQGVYRMPRVHVEADVVVTNATPVASYRGAGRPEATAFLERIMDMAAVELGIDPAELRRRNLIPPEEFPFTTHTGATYDVGEYEHALDVALETAGYAQLRAEQQARRDRQDVLQLGIGVSTYVEMTSAEMFVEYARIEIGDDGGARVFCGTAAQGQGHQTSYQMIVEETLGIAMDRITVVEGDTRQVPRGQGTMGSRSLQIGGSAVLRAAEAVRNEARRLAAKELDATEDDMDVLPGGRVGDPTDPDRSLTWEELADAAGDPLGAEVDFEQGGFTYPFGAHIAVVEVDTETGGVELLKHVAVDDCGKILNPLLVRGQQHGGIAQGVAQALFEGVEYDEDGNPLTATLIDYKIPSAAELPSYDALNTETPTPLNPLGAKGIGESGTIGSTPAVQNAVIDALAPYGVRHLDMPLTPEKVWRAIAGA